MKQFFILSSVRRVGALLAVAVLLATSASAATFTTAQKATLRADIVAKAAQGQPLQAAVAVGDWDAVAAYYNTTTAAFTVWRSAVTLGDVGRTFNATELAGLSSLNTQRLQNLAAWLGSGVNPSLTPVRQFFDDIFSGAGGTNTRAALLILWKRLANRLEQLFAVGTGSDAVPATLGVEGAITAQQLSDIYGLL